MLWRCANRHEWLANPDSIIQGGWCPECASRCGGKVTEMIVIDTM
ncbi:zinc-ribbon domain-containing protein [Polynucleobacter difficilis]